MVKKVYLIAGVALVAVLLVIGAFAYEKGIGSGTNQVSPSPTVAAVNLTAGEEVTAFHALAFAESDQQVTDWETGKDNVSITMISSDFCDRGFSDRWTISYVSDTMDVVVKLDNGTIYVTQPETSQGIPQQAQRITTTGLIDSTNASSIAIGTMNKAGLYPKGLASAKLTAKASGTYVWDLSFSLENGGYYIIRIDASSGNVIGSDQF
jgi:hypothetical protein